MSLLLLALTEGLAFVSTVVLRRAIDSLIPANRSGVGIGTFAFILFGLATVQGGMRFLSRYLMGYSSRQVEYEIRNDFFQHLLGLEPGYYVRHNVGDLISRAINDLNAIRRTLGQTLMFASSSVMRVPIAAVFLAAINWHLAIVTMLPAVTLPFIMKYVSTRIHWLFEEIQAQFSAMSGKVRESFTGVRVIKAYTQEEAEIRKFYELNEEFIERNKRLIRLEAVIFPLIMVVPGFSFMFLLWVGGYSVAAGQMTFGQFTQFQVILMMVIFPLASFGFTWSGLQRGAASMGRLNEIMETVPEIRDAEEATASEIEGEITFRDLTFSYNGTPVLKGINLHIPARSTVAIIGPTGCGKSTLVTLIPRLYQAAPGSVLIDGRDVRAYPLADLRAQIGFVQQETFLFSDSITENLRFGDVEADAEELKEVSSVAHLLPEIESFPSGFDTELGERGAMISGGQRQRTSIARALLRRPKVIIFDDAFASVDTYTEETILANLRDYLRDVTVLLISHRISTVQHADKIVVLHDGRIAEEGTHEELLAAGGFYADLYERQQLQMELEAM